MSRFKGRFSDRVFTCLFLLTLTGRILGQGNGPHFVKVFVKEDSDIILPCSLETTKNIKHVLFDWRKIGQKSPKEVFMYDFGFHYNNGRPGQDEQFKGRVSHFPDQLENGNASIIIRNTTMADSGNYTCAFPHLQPNGRIFHIELVVGAAPEPFISIADVTEFGVQLKCDVRGASPEPKLQWRDSDRNVLPAEEPQVSERGGRYDITLQTTVTKTTTNRFHCVVTQEEIGHMSDANITVSDKLFEDTKWSTGDLTGLFLGGFLSGVVTLVLGGALLVAAKCITVGFNRGPRQQRNGSYEAPAYSLEPRNSSYEAPADPHQQGNGSYEAPADPHQQGNGFIKGPSDKAEVPPSETTDISPA